MTRIAFSDSGRTNGPLIRHKPLFIETYFSLLAQKKSNKRKGTRLTGPDTIGIPSLEPHDAAGQKLAALRQFGPASASGSSASARSKWALILRPPLGAILRPRSSQCGRRFACGEIFDPPQVDLRLLGEDNYFTSSLNKPGGNYERKCAACLIAFIISSFESP